MERKRQEDDNEAKHRYHPLYLLIVRRMFQTHPELESWF